VSKTPFIALTMPFFGFDDQPLFINALHIREVRRRWVRKDGASGAGPEAYDLTGSWVTTGTGEDGTFPVCEEYYVVCDAINDALA
jgi:hypothetical protein